MEAEAVLKMEMIVEHIFNFLCVEDLKNARLVCRVWSLEGARQILLKGYFRVPPRFHKEKSSKEEEEEKTLIFNFLHPKNPEDGVASRKVPNVWIADDKDIQILLDLGVLSGNVKSLRFPPLLKFEIEAELAEIDDESTELQKWFKQLLSSELTSLSDFCFKPGDKHMSSFHIEQFLKLDKGHVIKAVDFKVSCDKHIETLEKLVEATPNLALESLVFGSGIKSLRQKQPVLFFRAINILNQLLASSATSLSEIKVMDTLGSVIELEIPTLRNLTTLTVVLPGRNQNQNQLDAEENLNQNSRLFPNVIESFCFPNLSKVTIGILGNDWLCRRVCQKITLQDKERLLPGLNPELKFSVYEFGDFENGKNQLLVCPQNSIPEERRVDSLSQQVDTSELDEERERMFRNINECCYFGGIVLVFFILALVIVALLVLLGPGVSHYRTASKEHEEMHRQKWEIHYMICGLLPSRICVGMEYTWKIPPIFACPKNIMDDETTTTTGFNSTPTWTLNLRQFTCQQAEMYSSNEIKALEVFQKGIEKNPLDLGSQLHTFLSYRIIPQGLLVFSQHLEISFKVLDDVHIIHYLRVD